MNRNISVPQLDENQTLDPQYTYSPSGRITGFSNPGPIANRWGIPAGYHIAPLFTKRGICVELTVGAGSGLTPTTHSVNICRRKDTPLKLLELVGAAGKTAERYLSLRKAIAE